MLYILCWLSLLIVSLKHIWPVLQPVIIDNIFFFFECAADVQVQSFANDGVEDHDEQIEDGGKSVEVRRSARLENLKHVRETEEMFVTPKRRKRSMQIGGQGTESDKERGSLLHVIPFLRIPLLNTCYGMI